MHHHVMEKKPLHAYSWKKKEEKKTSWVKSKSIAKFQFIFRADNSAFAHLSLLTNSAKPWLFSRGILFANALESSLHSCQPSPWHNSVRKKTIYGLEQKFERESFCLLTSFLSGFGGAIFAHNLSILLQTKNQLGLNMLEKVLSIGSMHWFWPYSTIYMYAYI